MRERLVGQDTARIFFDAVVGEARCAGLLSDGSPGRWHPDRGLGESKKSFKPKDGPPSGGAGSDGMVDFRGQRRSNDTHASTTDTEAKLARKSKGKEAKLSYGGHALMENRNGLCVDLAVRSAIQTETEAAKEMLARQRRKRVRPASLGGDKGYHTKDFVAHLRKHKIAPHIAQIGGRRTPGLDARTTRHASPMSQRKRKRVEEIFGWMKVYGGLRRTLMRNAAAASARLPRRRSLQPLAHESTVP